MDRSPFAPAATYGAAWAARMTRGSQPREEPPAEPPWAADERAAAWAAKMTRGAAAEGSSCASGEKRPITVAYSGPFAAAHAAWAAGMARGQPEEGHGCNGGCGGSCRGSCGSQHKRPIMAEFSGPFAAAQAEWAAKVTRGLPPEEPWPRHVRLDVRKPCAYCGMPGNDLLHQRLQWASTVAASKAGGGPLWQEAAFADALSAPAPGGGTQVSMGIGSGGASGPENLPTFPGLNGGGAAVPHPSSEAESGFPLDLRFWIGKRRCFAPCEMWFQESVYVQVFGVPPPTQKDAPEAVEKAKTEFSQSMALLAAEQSCFPDKGCCCVWKWSVGLQGMQCELTSAAATWSSYRCRLHTLLQGECEDYCQIDYRHLIGTGKLPTMGK